MFFRLLENAREYVIAGDVLRGIYPDIYWSSLYKFDVQ